MSSWNEVVALENIPVLGSRVFRTADQDIAIFRTRDDSVFALHNSCPHQGGVLSEGIVHGHKVTCPLHNWVINLEDGEAQGADEGHAACFETKVEAGIVFINL
ncbi:Nitrite reductase [NAD(P)H] small subunit [hydrothermal vent metagenome]|jgi:nitrite reductase (NADH) small subunit|uniref:Nitrite reductase [NAD(P)H] small subunit n=1 Tax=hydrothermal vent metagenome TaxID=652676 RepID=A0A1W1DEJ1_9ZZZZ|nr:nitrite reductase small subunit NirD [Piscirickettsiaceae bacterium]